MGLFSPRGRTPLVRINGTLNHDKQIQILKQFVLPFKHTFYPGCTNFLYQHDGCGPHRAKKVSIFLDAKSVNVLFQPEQSPDLNPIENVWSIIRQRLRLQENYSSNADALFTQLCEIWNALPSTYSKNLLESMNNRCNDVLSVTGRASKY